MNDAQGFSPEPGTREVHPGRHLLLLLGALLLGAAAVWLLREDWAKKGFLLWIPLLAAMFMGAQALHGLELWLPGTPMPPRLAQFAPARRRTIGIVCLGLALLATAWLVFRLWPDYHRWHGTPIFWFVALILMVAGAWLLSAVGHGAPRAATASTLWTPSRRNRMLELAAF